MPDFIQFLWWIYIFSYFVILDCISGFIAIWFRTIAQFETGLSFHFLYNSVTRKYNNLNNEFSFGKEPRFVTFLKLEFNFLLHLLCTLLFLLRFHN